MEKQLSKFKNKNKKIFVSSVRFANVSFSNGSILKYAVDRINEKKVLGIPQTIRRYFITHDEASSLCFKSLLKRNDKMVLISNSNFLNKEHLIKDLIVKILKINGYVPKFLSKIKNNKNIKVNKNYPILLTKPNTHGQKYYEEFYANSEKLYLDEKDKTIAKVNLPNVTNVDKILDTIFKFNKIDDIKKFLIKNFKSYKPPKNVIKVSQNL